MSDHDRLDRMERKLNRIGKLVLLGITLYTFLIVLELERQPIDLFYGYGTLASAAFIGAIVIFVIAARAPFRN